MANSSGATAYLADTSSATHRNVACHRCHEKKIKCMGGEPCENCLRSHHDCLFPVRERFVTVPEAYIQELQARANPPQGLMPRSTLNSERSSLLDGTKGGDLRTDHEQRLTSKLVFHDATAESFVRALDEVGSSPLRSSPDQLATASTVHREALTDYDYVTLDFERRVPINTIRLPPFLYATQLVRQFETFVGHEYHWYCRAVFHRRLKETYRCPSSPGSRDRIWLCQMFAVFALGASYCTYSTTTIELDESGTQSQQEFQGNRSNRPAGAEFFEQALSLLDVPSERCHLGYVEALNLVTFYSFSLNRRKTAYTYAGMAQRVAHCIMLHQPPGSSLPANEAEHRKRIWWTTYIMENMIASAVGLTPCLNFDRIQLDLPSAVPLASEDFAGFADHEIIKSNIQLYDIQSQILSTASRLNMSDMAGHFHGIHSQLNKLTRWRTNLAPQYAFELRPGFSYDWLEIPQTRSVASIYLRFHQVVVSLIRPVFVKALALVLGQEMGEAFTDELIYLSNECLVAARSNLKMFEWLSTHERLAKYGFWESLHLFSGISVIELSRLINDIRPHSLTIEANDEALAASSRLLLITMADAGNLASKAHCNMLERIKLLLDRLPPTTLELDMFELFDWEGFDAQVL